MAISENLSENEKGSSILGLFCLFTVSSITDVPILSLLLQASVFHLPTVAVLARCVGLHVYHGSRLMYSTYYVDIVACDAAIYKNPVLRLIV
jgi:hypothetical protein